MYICRGRKAIWLILNCLIAILSLVSVFTHSVIVANVPEPSVCWRFQFCTMSNSVSKVTVVGPVGPLRLLLLAMLMPLLALYRCSS